MRLGIMCSGNGTNFENIVRTCSKDEVVIMIHNKKDCGALREQQSFAFHIAMSMPKMKIR